MGYSMIAFWDLPPEAQAAWAQAVLTVLAIGVAIVVPAYQHRVTRRMQRASDLRQAKSLALIVDPLLPVYGAMVNRASKKFDRDVAAVGRVDWFDLTEGLALGENAKAIIPQLPSLDSAADDVQKFFILLNEAVSRARALDNSFVQTRAYESADERTRFRALLTDCSEAESRARKAIGNLWQIERL